MKVVALIAVVVSALLLFTPYYLYAPVPALALIGAFVIARNPAIGFYLIVLLIPFGAFRKIGPVNIPWVISAVVLVVLAFGVIREKRLPPVSRSNLWPLIGLYIVASILSTLFADYPEMARLNLFLLLAGYGFVFIGMMSLSLDAYRTHIPNLVVWGVGLSAALACMGYFLGWTLFTQQNTPNSLVRSTGGAIDPNNLSMMVLFTLPLAVHRVMYPRSPGERLLASLVIPILFLTMISTFSRSGFLVMMFCLALLMFHYRGYLRPRILGIFLLLAGCGLVLTIYTVPANFWERQLSILSWEDNSLNRRYSYLKVGAESIAANPLLGTGPGTFKEVYRNSETSLEFTHRQADRGRRAHNTYLEVLVGTGFLGFLLFMALTIRAVQNFRVAEREFQARGDPELANLAASQRIAYLTLMLFLLTFSEQYHKFMLLSLVLSQGAIYFAQRQVEKKADELSELPPAANTA